MSAAPLNRGCMLVLGGARSGKSGFALNAGNALGRKRWFLATAQAGDEEMAERIRRHRAERGPEWTTIEEPFLVAETILAVDAPDTVILVDCLTLWLSNLFMKYGQDQDAVEEAVSALCSVLSRIRGTVIVVSNEVGLGIVPTDALSRRFRDTAGRMNRLVAEKAVRVTVVLAGLPLVLKG